MSAPKSHVSTEPTQLHSAALPPMVGLQQLLRPNLKSDALGCLSYYPLGKIQGMTSKCKPLLHSTLSSLDPVGGSGLPGRSVGRPWVSLRGFIPAAALPSWVTSDKPLHLSACFSHLSNGADGRTPSYGCHRDT